MNRYYLQTVRHLLAATHHFVKKECVRLVQIRAQELADRARRGDGRLTRSFMHGPVFGHHHAVRVSVGRATTLPSSCPQTMQKLHSKASDHTHQAHTHTPQKKRAIFPLHINHHTREHSIMMLSGWTLRAHPATLD